MRFFRRSIPCGALAAVGLCAGLAAATHAGAPAFSVTIADLGTLSGDLNSRANDVNRRGDAVGSSYNVDDQGKVTAARPVAWIRGELRPLPMPAGAAFGRAYGNNDAGLMVGVAGVLDGPQQAVLWKGRYVTSLGTLPGGGNSFAGDINNRRQILGSAFNADGHERAVIWERGRIRNLGVLPGRTESTPIMLNDRGQAICVAYNLDAEKNEIDRRAVLWDGRRLRALGELPGGKESIPNTLANTGQVVGWATDAGGARRAVVWQGGRISLLPTPEGSLASEAGSNNDRGQIIGTVKVAENDVRLYLWEKGGKSTDLTPSLPAGWTDLVPYILNNSGELVGYGKLNGNTRAFFLTFRRRG